MSSTIDINAIPAVLRERDQWVCWKYLPPLKPGGKPRKVPFQPSGETAKTDDSTTWTAFDAALEAWQNGGFGGIGCVFAPDDPFTGIDLDGCIVHGQWTPGAQAIVDNFGTYP